MRVRNLAVFAFGGLCAFSVQAPAADLDYKVPGYSYDYCLEIAREEANANIGMVYLHPQLVQGEQSALTEKQVLKQRKHEAQREQRKEKCI